MTHQDIVVLKLGTGMDDQDQDLILFVEFDADEAPGASVITIKKLSVSYKNTLEEEPQYIELPTGMFTIAILEYIATCIAEDFIPVGVDESDD